MDLKNANVIVTGGNSGIGYETAKQLAEAGAKVIISGRNEDKLSKAAKELNVLHYKADMTQENEIVGLINYAIETWGSFNVLINNAGYGTFASLTDTTTEDFEQILSTNTKGLFIAGREAAKHFKDKQYGNIINIGSSSAVKGHQMGSAYCASKFAVTGLTEVWRAELRPFNIRVMQVNPSEVITDFMTKVGLEPKNVDKKLKASEVAHVINSMLTMNDVGFMLDTGIWATNPW